LSHYSFQVVLLFVDAYGFRLGLRIRETPRLRAYFKCGIQLKYAAEAEKHGAKFSEMWSPNACHVC